MRIPIGRARAITTRGLRRAVQLLVFGLFVALFIGTVPGFPVLGSVPSDLFLRTSPLIAAATMLARWAVIWTMLIPAAVVLIVTVLLGRAYCGWFCPMGTLLDIVERTALRLRRGRPWDQARSDRLRAVKYVLLVVILASALFGRQPLLFLDPISTLHRSATVAIHAPLDTAAKDIASAMYRPLRARGIRLRPPAERRYAQQAALVLAMLVGIVGLSALQRRFWCRYLCPLGALLGLCSAVPLLRRRVQDSCTHCLQCERRCKMGCIHESGMRYRVRECIACYECEVCCPVGAVSFPVAHARRECLPGMDKAHQLTRRRVIGGFGAALGWLLIVRSSPSGRVAARYDRLKPSRRLRPPGAMPERQFLELCARCGECIKVCPTSAIQAALAEAGPEGLFTPVVVPRVGACKERCNACGQVCPTGAIQPFRIEDKNPRLTNSPATIGLATIDRNMCRAWYRDQTCSVCDEQCPYDAIASRPVRGMLRPFVMEEFCTGCGACEKECPIEPVAAITVTTRGEHRRIYARRTGPGDAFGRPDASARIVTPNEQREPDTTTADDAWERNMAQYEH